MSSTGGPPSSPGHHGPPIIVSRFQKPRGAPDHTPGAAPNAAPSGPKPPSATLKLAKQYRGYILGAAGLAAAAGGYFGWVAPKLEESAEEDRQTELRKQNEDAESRKPLDEIKCMVKLWAQNGKLHAAWIPQVSIDTSGALRSASIELQKYDDVPGGGRCTATISVIAGDNSTVYYVVSLFTVAEGTQETAEAVELTAKLHGK